MVRSPPTCLVGAPKLKTTKSRASRSNRPTTSPTSIAHIPSTTATSAGCSPQVALGGSSIKPALAALKLSIDTAAPINKMAMSSVISPMRNQAASPTPSLQQGLGRPVTMTTKEWVVPPRPKPGRKPATDMPPTKRKAQNRAAQRAFRERRAARVGELEEQLDEQKEDHEREVDELQDRINQLEIEHRRLQSRCQWLEALLDKERQARKGASGIGWADNHTKYPRHASNDGTSGAVPGPGLTPTGQSLSISQIIAPHGAAGDLNLTCGDPCALNGPCACAGAILSTAAAKSPGCGKCGVETTCACLESLQAGTTADLKRTVPGSPTMGAALPEKRQRFEPEVMEMDFTGTWVSCKKQSKIYAAAPRPPPPSQQAMLSVELRDSCGFCKDGTYCVCEDATVGMPVPTILATSISQQKMHTPPPSENDVAPRAPSPMDVTVMGAVPLPGVLSFPSSQARPANSANMGGGNGGGCGSGGPGTCAQCLADPKAGLFCRSLAANYAKTSLGDTGGCCGNAGPRGCCKRRGLPQPASAPSSGLGLSLSCSEAYKTLSSHRHFEEAADEIGLWLPNLKAVPAGSDTLLPRPAPIEVEAASIMSVLKGFDVRFGRGQ